MVKLIPWSRLGSEQPRHAAPVAMSYGCRVDGARRVSCPRIRRAGAVRFFWDPQISVRVEAKASTSDLTVSSEEVGKSAARRGSDLTLAAVKMRAFVFGCVSLDSRTFNIQFEEQHGDFTGEYGC